MRIHSLHDWNLTPQAAIALQHELAVRVETRTPLTRCRRIAGADISYSRHSNRFHAGVVVLDVADLRIIESVTAEDVSTFPYVPGLLSFREAPALLKAFAQVQAEPDVVMLDGQGIAHPRRLGLAAHVGLWLDCPTIGCAKSRLIGTYRELGEEAGSVAPLQDRGETVGMVVRTKRATRPLFISAGHRIDLPSAVRVVLQTTGKYRIPEPTRQAHLLVNRARAEASASP